jgi:predicted DNA-binding ribbon-helix-helix protein
MHEQQKKQRRPDKTASGVCQSAPHLGPDRTRVLVLLASDSHREGPSGWCCYGCSRESEASTRVVKLSGARICDPVSSRSSSAESCAMKTRRIDIFGHQTSLTLEPEYWRWLAEVRAKTGASLRDVIEAVAANKAPGQSLASAIRVAVTRYFHGGDPTIYRCPGHLVPARDGGLHLSIGKAAKAGRGRRLSVRRASQLRNADRVPA